MDESSEYETGITADSLPRAVEGLSLESMSGLCPPQTPVSLFSMQLSSSYPVASQRDFCAPGA